MAAAAEVIDGYWSALGVGLLRPAGAPVFAGATMRRDGKFGAATICHIPAARCLPENKHSVK
jgi:hypothetical protein